MPRLKPREATIYNKEITGIPPALGNARITRKQTFEHDVTQNGNVENISAKQVENQRHESHLKMSEISKSRTDVLFQARTVFPFDLFPKVLTISSTKIEAKLNSFFYTYSTVTIPLQDIANVELNSSLFFSTLNVINIRSKDPLVMRFLWNRDAIKGKKLINGLLIAQESGVDVSVIEPKKLLPQLEGLGA